MRIHLKNVKPEINGLVQQHKASHNHKNLDETVSCLIEEAMRRIDDADKHEDQKALFDFYIHENEKLKIELKNANMQIKRFRAES